MKYTWYFDKNWLDGPLWGWDIKHDTKYGSVVEVYYGPFTKYRKLTNV